MSQILRNLVIVFVCVLFVFPALAEKKDCSCPQLTCGPCQKKVNIGKTVNFCDWGDINVCRKQICENVNYYFNCLSQYNKNKSENDKKLSDDGMNFLYEKDMISEKKSKKEKRNLASAQKKKRSNDIESDGLKEVGNESRVILGKEYSELKIGSAKNDNSKIQVFHRGKLSKLKKKNDFYVGDEISNLSSKNEKLEIEFSNGAVSLELLPKTKIVVEDPESIVGRFQPFFYLVHGGVDAVVQLTEGSFDLLAGQILSRSKGGEHKVRYEMAPEGLRVKVESVKNSLEIMKAHDLSGHKVIVEAGQFLSWISETPGHLFNSDEKMALAGEGFLSPIFEMTENRKKELGLVPLAEKKIFADWTQNENKKGRRVASLEGDSGLCQTPQAKYQQCAWSCEGNGKADSSCQAEKQNVHCVRRICNAAGQWGLPTVFASSYKDLCPAKGVRVGDCSP